MLRGIAKRLCGTYNGAEALPFDDAQEVSVEANEYELDNGLTVVLQRKPSAPVVSCNVWVGAGSADERPDEAGVAHVHEHMLFKGTDRRGVGEIAREIEASGGRINAFTSFDQTCYFVTMSSRHLEAGLDVLSDAVWNATFDADELERELEVIREEIKRVEDNPSKMAGLKLFETAYSEHPYRIPIIGTEESVASFDREDVRGFFERHYVPENMTLVVAGDFEADALRAMVEEYFGGADREESYEPPERRVEPEQSAVRSWVDARPIQQSQLRLGFHIPPPTHDDIPALDLLGAILGYGDASHLVQTIRRDREWVNSISATAYTPEDAGLFIVSANYQLDEDGRDHGDTLRAVAEEMFRFREAPPSRGELDRARTIIESQEIYGRQTVEGLAMKLGRYEMVTGDPNYEERYHEALREVTPERIREVARTYLTPANCSVVLMHPADDPEVDGAELEGEVEAARETIRAEAVAAEIETDEHGVARVELSEGPTLVVQEDHSVETFAIRGLALGGLRYEPEGQNGVNELTSMLTTRGTERRSALEISHEVESMAGSISGLSGRNTSGLTTSGLSRFFDESFDIFADCLLGASIPDEEFERERKRLVQKIRGRRDRLEAVNFDRLADAFFSPHPYARPTLGTEEAVAGLEAEDVRTFHRRIADPEGLVLAVVGDVEPAEVLDLAERYFVQPEAESRPAPEVPEPDRREEPRTVVGDLEKEQAHVAVGFDAPEVGSEDEYPLRVLYAVLSGQGGRLFYQLRDRESLAYSVRAKTLLGLDAGTFAILIGTSPSKIERAVRGIFREVRRVRQEGITDEELERAKRFLIGNHDIGLQKNKSRALSLGLDELYGLGFERSLRFADRIDEVDGADVRRAAEEYLVPGESVTAVTKPEDVGVDGDLARRVLSDLRT